MDRFVCPQGNDAAIAQVKKFKAAVEDSINAINEAKKKIDEVPDAATIVGKNYDRTLELLSDVDNIVCKQYPLLVENYENFIKKMQETDERIKQ